MHIHRSFPSNKSQDFIKKHRSVASSPTTSKDVYKN